VACFLHYTLATRSFFIGTQFLIVCYNKVFVYEKYGFIIGNKTMLKDLIIKNRTYRRFYQDTKIERQTLRELVDLARLSASAANLQPLKYMLCCEPEKNALVFPHLSWAGYLKDWSGPAEGERPSAYIIILGDTEISRSFGCDHGIAAQSIILGATEKGLGGCMIGTVQRQELRKALDIPVHYEILLVLALGKPKEKVVIESVAQDGDVKYWRDAQGVHHVPKRSLDEIIS
jgi:nitroreductase